MHYLRTLVISLCFATLTWAQFPTTNPIPGAVPNSGLVFRLEPVIRIPEFHALPPRLELLTHGSDDTLYVHDQHGPMYRFRVGEDEPQLIANFHQLIDNFVAGGGQRSLRSFAFHPGHEDPDSDGFGKLYTAHSVATSVGGANHDSVVAEWTLTSDGIVDENIPSREILRVTQPRGDHNIGRIGFDPNALADDTDFGKLFIALGDGGNYRVDGGDATLNPNGQDSQQLLGKILRIDPVMPDSAAGLAYTVPADNPFVNEDGFRPEIWAQGLRNPHTFGWDLGGNGNMYIGDIGQSDIEEINLGAAGANYGWSEREGTFSVSGKAPLSSQPIAVDALPIDHADDEFTYPVAQYDHAPDDNRNFIGNAAVAGGFVYRSDRLPALKGKYFFGDFANNTGPIWAVDEQELGQEEDFSDLTSQDNGYLAPFGEIQLVNDDGEEVTLLDILRESTGRSNLRRTDLRFGQGRDGEVYILNKHDGWIRRFAAAVEGDCNGDGVVTADDLDCACGAIEPLLTSLGLHQGDIDANGVVAFEDFLILSENFGLTSDNHQIGYREGDLNCDGQIQFDDFLILAQNFGKTGNDAVGAQNLHASRLVPEPSTSSVLCMLLVIIFAVRSPFLKRNQL